MTVPYGAHRVVASGAVLTSLTREVCEVSAPATRRSHRSTLRGYPRGRSKVDLPASLLNAVLAVNRWVSGGPVDILRADPLERHDRPTPEGNGRWSRDKMGDERGRPHYWGRR